MTLFKPPIGSSTVTNATTLNGKTEGQLSVGNSALLNSKSESNLDVKSADFADNAQTFASHEASYFAQSAGTPSSTFQIDNDASGPIIKNSSGTIYFRDSTDSSNVTLYCEDVNASNVNSESENVHVAVRSAKFEGNSDDYDEISFITKHDGTETAHFDVTTNSLTSNNYGRTILLLDSLDLSYNTYQLYDFISAKDSTAYQSLSSPSGSVTITSNPTVKAQITVNNDGNENLVWHAGNDGSGSGLDADLLDGYDSSYFATSGGTPDQSFTIYKDNSTYKATLTADVFSGNRTQLKCGTQFLTTSTNYTNGYAGISSNGSEAMFSAEASGDYNSAIVYSAADLVYSQLMTTSYEHMSAIDVTNNKTYLSLSGPNSHSIVINVSGVSGTASTIKVDTNTVWHAGNDGAGSGLDADKLGGSSYASYPIYYGALTSEPATYKPGDEYYNTGSSSLMKYISYDIGWKTITTT